MSSSGCRAAADLRQLERTSLFTGSSEEIEPMFGWTVNGRGVEVTVVSPVGDVYPFVITSTERLDLALGAQPTWHDGRPPQNAALRIRAAHGAAARWTYDTFGPPSD